MAGKKISQLTHITNISGDEKIPVAINNSNGYVLASEIGKDSYTKDESDARYLQAEMGENGWYVDGVTNFNGDLEVDGDLVVANVTRIRTLQIGEDNYIYNANSGEDSVLYVDNVKTDFEGDAVFNGDVEFGTKPTVWNSSSQTYDSLATEPYVDTVISTKQNTLTSTQLAAVNSGITAELVSQIGNGSTDITYITDEIGNGVYSPINLNVEYGKTYHIIAEKTSQIAFELPYWEDIGNNPNNGKEIVIRLQFWSSNIPTILFYGGGLFFNNGTLVDTSEYQRENVYEFNIVAFQNKNLITSAMFAYNRYEIE